MERAREFFVLPKVEQKKSVVGRRIKNIALAARAMGESLPLLRESKVRCATLAALRYTGIVKNIPMTREQLLAASDFLKLGIGNNDFFDDKERFDFDRQLKSRRCLRHYEGGRQLAEYPIYLSVLKRIEKTRPLCGEQKQCVSYREELNLISLGYLFGVVFNRPMSEFISISSRDVKLLEGCPKCFESMYHVVMALQVVDDLIGWKGDVSYQRPSFFTAFGNESLVEELSPQVLKERFCKMDDWFDSYIQKAQKVDPNFILPIKMVIKLIQQGYPKIVKAAKALGSQRLGLLFTTRRDLQDK